MSLMRKSLSWLLLFIVCSARGVQAETPTITFSCWIPAYSPIYLKLERIYRASFKSLGYNFQMIHQPMQRAIQDANIGTTDGECARDFYYLESAPESRLLRVEVMVVSSDLDVWSNNAQVKIANLTELNNSPLRIAYILGSSPVKTVFTPERLAEAQGLVSGEIGIKMLSAGRIDLLVIPATSVKRILRNETPAKPLYRAGTLLRQRAYAYLNPRYSALLQPLAKQLRQRVPEGGVQLD